MSLEDSSFSILLFFSFLFFSLTDAFCKTMAGLKPDGRWVDERLGSLMYRLYDTNDGE
jgi:hypothetical protein